jgi:ABC-type nitrate/sulfonate/bicarbonate transport system permease component
MRRQLLGAFALCLLWELVGRLRLLTEDLPALTTVVKVFGDARFTSLLWTDALVSAREAAVGYAIGNALAAAVAIAVALVPVLSGPATDFAVLVQAIPLIALVPLLSTSVWRDSTPVVAAALAVAFTTFVAVETGLRAVPEPLGHVFDVLGARRTTRLRLLQLPMAVPALLEGLKIAAPASIVGAILGEWFGASSGIGPLIVSSLQNYQVPELWAAGLTVAAPAVMAYAALDALQTRTMEARA